MYAYHTVQVSSDAQGNCGIRWISFQNDGSAESNDTIHVVIDSTGLKVFGEGEWKVRILGYSKRGTWRKLHLAIDESNNRIVALVLSTKDFKDNEVFVDLMEQLNSDEIQQVTGDVAYDDRKCFQWAQDNNVIAVLPRRPIPP